MLKSPIRSGGMARPGEVVAPNSRGSVRSRRAGLGDPAEHVDRPLVEPEVVHRADDLAVLDQVDAVPGQAGQQQRLRVDLADVPQAGQQQAALGRRRPSRPGSTGAAGRRGMTGCRRTACSGRPVAPRVCRRASAGRPARRRVDPARSAGVGRPLSKTELTCVRCCARPRTARTPGPAWPGRCAASAGSVGDSRSPMRVPPPAGRDTVRPSSASRARPRPVRVDHQVGDRARRQQRLVAPGRQVDPALRPAQPRRRARRPARATSTSAKSRVGTPTQAEPVEVGATCALSSQAAGGLRVPAPQAGRRRRGTSSRSSCSAKPNSSRPAAARPAERLAERRGEVGEHVDRRWPRAARPSRRVRRRRRPAARRPRPVRRPRAAGLARGHQIGDVVEVDAGRGRRRRRPCPSRRRSWRSTVTSARLHHAVGGQACCSPSAGSPRSCSLDQHDAAVGAWTARSARSTSCRARVVGHCPASSHGVEDADAAEQRRRAAVADRRDLARLALAAVERAAEHVGLAGRRRASIEPQKSVVVAW